MYGYIKFSSLINLRKHSLKFFRILLDHPIYIIFKEILLDYYKSYYFIALRQNFFYFHNKIVKSDTDVISVDTKCLDPSVALGLMSLGM